MTTQLAWFLLLIAGLLEIFWAVGLKFTEGFTRPWPSALTIVAMVLSMVLLAQTVRVRFLEDVIAHLTPLANRLDADPRHLGANARGNLQRRTLLI